MAACNWLQKLHIGDRRNTGSRLWLRLMESQSQAWWLRIYRFTKEILPVRDWEIVVVLNMFIRH